MRYAKLINGSPAYAPNPILVDGNWIGNPPGSVYEEQGYKLVTFTEQPEAPSGYRCVETWTETEDAIVQGWELREIQDDEEISADEALQILLGGVT